LIVPTRRETEAVIAALPNAVPDLRWEIPSWRAGDLFIFEPGMGPDLAEAILPCLEAQEPGQVWLFGWCGGLRQELRAGDLVLGDATIVKRESGLVQRILHPPSESLLGEVRRVGSELGRRIVLGPVLTSDDVLRSVAQKQAAATTGAVAVEMEAVPLARWARLWSLPFVHLRVVLDPLWSALPPTDLPTDGRGNTSIAAIAGYAVAHPRQCSALWRLFRHISVARRIMSDVIAALSRPGGPLGAEGISGRGCVQGPKGFNQPQ
jgi:nucleoside phosphorylase